MFGVNVTYIMKAGKRMDFLEEIGMCGVQAEIRREEGCLQYDFFLPLDDKDRLLLMEKWTSREAQQLHQTQPHMDKLRALKERYVEDTKLEFYELDD